MSYQRYTTVISVSCLVGVLLSVYALLVEVKAESDSKYVAFCDISEHVSCTKVFMSEYGRGFGVIGRILGEDSPLNVPNSVFGIIFYTLTAVLGFTYNLRAAKAQVLLSGLSNFLSVYLAYLLYFVLEDFCVVCVSCYAVNFVNFVYSWKRYNAVVDLSTQKDRKRL